jgi:hypothetical protein
LYSNWERRVEVCYANLDDVPETNSRSKKEQIYIYLYIVSFVQKNVTFQKYFFLHERQRFLTLLEETEIFATFLVN